MGQVRLQMIIFGFRHAVFDELFLCMHRVIRTAHKLHAVPNCSIVVEKDVYFHMWLS